MGLVSQNNNNNNNKNKSTILGLHSCRHKYKCSKSNPSTIADLAYYKYAILQQFNQETHSSLKKKKKNIIVVVIFFFESFNL